MANQEKQPDAVGGVWYLYILRCRDGSFYTGVTTDIDRRLRQHRKGTASRYTRSRRPLMLIHQEKCGNRSQALRRECVVKALSRRRKEELIRDVNPLKAKSIRKSGRSS